MKQDLVPRGDSHGGLRRHAVLGELPAFDFSQFLPQLPPLPLRSTRPVLLRPARPARTSIHGFAIFWWLSRAESAASQHATGPRAIALAQPNTAQRGRCCSSAPHGGTQTIWESRRANGVASRRLFVKHTHSHRGQSGWRVDCADGARTRQQALGNPGHQGCEG